MNPDSAYMVGVDIKASCLNIGLMNFTGDMVDVQMGVECRLYNTLESLEELTLHIRNLSISMKLSKKESFRLG